MTMRAGTRRRLVSAGLTAALLVSFGLLVACAGGVPKRNTKPKPAVSQFEKKSLSVGEEFVVRGTNFLNAEGRTKLHFEGDFQARDGSSSAVDVRAPLAVDKPEDASEKSKRRIGTWLRFGPFTNPFSKKPAVGTFQGMVTPVNIYYEEDGSKKTVRGESRSVQIRVEPSVEIVELQPKKADCGAPAIRGFPGADYRIKVRATGFAPQRFEWRVSSIIEGKSIRETKTFRHPASGPTDTLGDAKGETIDFEPVPKGTKYYVAGIQVRAKDRATGKYVHTSLPLGIHRPVEVRSAGPFEVAEHYEPQPVTACIPGAIGNKATYSETETEVRQRTMSVGVSQNFTREQMRSTSVNWMKGYGVSNTRSRTRSRSQSRTQTQTTARTESQSYNQSRSNSFNYGTEHGETWRVGNEVGGEVSASAKGEIPLVAEGEVTVTGHYNRSWGRSGTTTKSKSWGNTVTKGESHSFSKSYTLSDSVSSSHSYSDTKSRSESRTYNFGKSATRSQRISKGITESEEKTWMRSKSSSTLTQYSAFIPPEKFGVFYRQTIRMVRRAELVSFTACGEMKHMGEIQLNTWNWAPDLATGKNCREELPEPNLPPADCHIKPCK